MAESEPDAHPAPVAGRGRRRMTSTDTEPVDRRAEPRRRPPPDPNRVRRTLEGVIGVPATEGNCIDVLRNGDEIFPSMWEAIEARRAHDRLPHLRLLGRATSGASSPSAPVRPGPRRRARAGAARRVGRPRHGEGADRGDGGGRRASSAGSGRCGGCGPARSTTAPTARCSSPTRRWPSPAAWASPTSGAATPATPAEWRDTHFRIEGPAVDGLRAAFLDNWAETDTGAVRRGRRPLPGPAEAGQRRRAVRAGRVGDRLQRHGHPLPHAAAAGRARRCGSRRRTSCPTCDLGDRLCAAADRGVDVQILLPGPHIDKRFVQIAAEGEYERLHGARRRASGTSSRPCSTPR